MPEVFDNDSSRRRDRLSTLEMRRRLRFTCKQRHLIQKMLRLFGHAARCPERELIRNLLVPTPSRTWFRRTGGQLKTRATTLKEDLKLLTGPRVLEYGQWVRD